MTHTQKKNSWQRQLIFIHNHKHYRCRGDPRRSNSGPRERGHHKWTVYFVFSTTELLTYVWGILWWWKQNNHSVTTVQKKQGSTVIGMIWNRNTHFWGGLIQCISPYAHGNVDYSNDIQKELSVLYCLGYVRNDKISKKWKQWGPQY